MGRRKKKEHDFAVTAFRVVQEAIGENRPIESAKDQRAVARGKARAAKLSPKQRQKIAQKAAKARWS